MLHQAASASVGAAVGVAVTAVVPLAVDASPCLSSPVSRKLTWTIGK